MATLYAAGSGAVPRQVSRRRIRRREKAGFGAGQVSRRGSERLTAVARLARPNDRLSAVLDLELVEERGHVVAHGFLGKPEPGPDLRVVQAVRDELEDLGLARGQPGEGGRFLRVARRKECPQLGTERSPCRLGLDE